MGTQDKSVNASAILGAAQGDITWSTTAAPLTPEEEDAIVTLVVVVIGIIVAIVVLFSMGIFIDCRHQKKDSMKKRRLRLKMPPMSRARRVQREDVKSLASDMCPNGASDAGFQGDAIV